LSYRPLDLPVILVAGGVVLGVVQWFALRRWAKSWTILTPRSSSPRGSAGLLMGLVTVVLPLLRLGRENATTLATP
jgi:hypothetical protein